MSGAEPESDYTSLRVSRSTHERLKDIRPYDSMSFDELIDEMADTYRRVRDL